MLRWGWDDWMPVLLIAGAVIGVWLFNIITGARPGRRRRGLEPPDSSASPPAIPPGG